VELRQETEAPDVGPMHGKYVHETVVENKWPWYIRWLQPHDGRNMKRLLMKCECGRVHWKNAPEKIRRHHVGHQFRLCETANVWWFIKMKLGLLNYRTLNEWAKDFATRYDP
jgi:hypothetical protein